MCSIYSKSPQTEVAFVCTACEQVLNKYFSIYFDPHGRWSIIWQVEKCLVASPQEIDISVFSGHVDNCLKYFKLFPIVKRVNKLFQLDLNSCRWAYTLIWCSSFNSVLINVETIDSKWLNTWIWFWMGRGLFYTFPRWHISPTIEPSKLSAFLCGQ